MITVYKYKLKLVDEQIIDMPARGEVLAVKMQGNDICAWVKVDTDMPMGNTTFYIRGTGHEVNIPHDAKFIDSVLMHDGMYVWHVWAWS